MNTNRLQHIWSEKFWNECAEWIENKYFNLLPQNLKNIPNKSPLEPTNHRIEKFVRELCHKTGRGAYHIGLTSSDLEDNIRTIRIVESYNHISKKLESLTESLAKMLTNKVIRAYTHLLPAGQTTLTNRFAHLLEYQKNIPDPVIHFKGIGGSVGRKHVQKHLKIDVVGFFPPEYAKTQTYCSQTGNHLSEIEITRWISEQTVFLTKLANDLRMMVVFNQIKITEKDVASTALVQKPRPNPWRLERVVGMSNEIFNKFPTVCRAAADCMLERTLTNQSVLNYALKELFLLIESMIRDINEFLQNCEFIVEEEENDPEIELADLMTEKRIDRRAAYKIINNKHKNLWKI